MNKTIEQFARTEILHGLNQCSEEQVLVFKRMYSRKNLQASVTDVVASIPKENLDWALTQIQNTLGDKRQARAHPSPGVVEHHKESVRLLSELLDQAADLLGVADKDRGEPDILLDAIEALKEKAALSQPQQPSIKPACDKQDADSFGQFALSDHPLIKFLLGEGEYKGLQFGDHVMRGKYKARYWWRSDLRELVAAKVIKEQS